MVGVLIEEFIFRFRKYWRLQFSSGRWWWLIVYWNFTKGEFESGFFYRIASYIFWGILILLLCYIGDLGLYFPNQLNKTMFFMPISSEERKKYICSVLWAKVGIISAFFAMSSLVFGILGCFPVKWILCIGLTGVFWGIVVIFGDVQLQKQAVGKTLKIKRELYQSVNFVIYFLYLLLFIGKSLKRTVFPSWWFQVFVWMIQLVLIVYTVRMKMPLVLRGHDYEAVCRRDDI